MVLAGVAVGVSGFLPWKVLSLDRNEVSTQSNRLESREVAFTWNGFDYYAVKASSYSITISGSVEPIADDRDSYGLPTIRPVGGSLAVGGYSPLGVVPCLLSLAIVLGGLLNRYGWTVIVAGAGVLLTGFVALDVLTDYTSILNAGVQAKVSVGSGGWLLALGSVFLIGIVVAEKMTAGKSITRDSNGRNTR